MVRLFSARRRATTEQPPDGEQATAPRPSPTPTPRPSLTAEQTATEEPETAEQAATPEQTATEERSATPDSAVTAEQPTTEASESEASESEVPAPEAPTAEASTQKAPEPEAPASQAPAEASTAEQPTVAEPAASNEEPPTVAEPAASNEEPPTSEHPSTPEPPPPAEQTAAAANEPPELPNRAQSPFGRPTVTENDGARVGATAVRLPGGVTPGMLVAAVGALLTFLAAFLTWATADFTSRVANLPPGGVVDSASGLTGNRLGKATLVLAIALLILIALMRLPATSAKAWIVLAAGGGLISLVAVLDLFAIINDSDLPDRLAAVQGCGVVVQCTAERSAGIGVYLTILGGLIVLVGALMHGGVIARLQEGLRSARSSSGA